MARWRAAWFAGLGVIVSVSLALPTFAQFIDPSGRSAEPPEIQKKKPLRPEPPPNQILPPVPSTPLEGRKEKGPILRVFVKKINVVGSTVFSADELAKVTAPYENREASTEDLEELRRVITLMYVNKGYANSGAVIPDQAVSEGVVTIQVIEGTLSDIRIQGNKWFRTSYLRDRIELGTQPPFNMNPLRDRLQLLLQDPRLERLNAELKPGLQLGQAELDVIVQEANPFHAYVEYNDYITPTVGENQFLGTVVHDNLTGNGDTLRVTFGASATAFPWNAGVWPNLNASYAIPLNRYDTTFLAGYRLFNFKVVDGTFQPLDIESKTQVWTLSLRQPIYRTLTDEIAVAVMGEYEQNGNTLLGVPFDFVNGMKNGFANVAALRFIQDWTHRTPVSVFSVRSRFTAGIDVLGATTNSTPGAADGQFLAWLGQADLLHRFESTGIELLNFTNLQVANDRLFPIEQMPVGGRYSVRGYRENTLLHDNGFVNQLETRLPLLKGKEEGGVPYIQLCPFADVGHSWVAKGVTPSPQTLASVGAGLRFNLAQAASLNVYWGHRLVTNDVANPHNSLQDAGVHVQFVANLY
jgi:hemolysin activation/secretion protein